MKKRERKGSWSVLAVTMALAYATSRWIASRWTFLVAPFTFFIKFIALHYGDDIHQAGLWIKDKLKKFFWRLKSHAKTVQEGAQ